MPSPRPFPACRRPRHSSLQHLTVKQNGLKVTGDRIAEVLKGNRTLLSLPQGWPPFVQGGGATGRDWEAA